MALNRTVCGTPLFMAPEILLRKAYNAFAVDVWALGVTLFIMMTLELPFDFRDQNKAVKDMVTRNWSWPSGKMKASPSVDLKEYASGMMEPESGKRITMNQLCEHKWMSKEFGKAQAQANKK